MDELVGCEPEADHTASTAAKLLWAISIAHLFFLNLQVNVSVPEDWQAYAGLMANILLAVCVGAYGFLTWLLARGVSQQRPWSRVIVVTLVLLSMLPRVPWLFTSNSMFDGAKFRFSFFLTVALLVAEAVLVYLLFSPFLRKPPELDAQA